MTRKLINRVAVWLLKKKGYSVYMAPLVWRSLCDDFFMNSGVTLRNKLWAYKRGFLSERISCYSLNDTNYTAHLPDLEYWRMHPINGRYGKWIDDKLTMRYILNPYANYLPRYYYQLQNGRVLPLIDCRQSPAATDSLDSILALLQKRGFLALKPLAASGGRGFCKLSFCDDHFCLNEKQVSRDQMRDFLRNLENYIVTEYITSHPAIRTVYDVTPNTLRLMVIHDEQNGPRITGAFMRFGIKETGMIDNAGAGAVYCGVTLSEGQMFSPKRDVDGRIIDVEVHPDTGVPIAGRLPHWDLVSSKTIEIACAFPQIRYMGFDIIITDSAFKIIEINSHQSLRHIEPYYPVMQDEYCRHFFGSMVKGARRKRPIAGYVRSEN